MKKIFNILLFSFVSIGLYSQADTITMDQMPQATSLADADKFWILQSGVDKYIEAQDFIHWDEGSGTLYVPDITRRVGIGTTTPSSDYLLECKGTFGVSNGHHAYFTGTVFIGSSSYIKDSYNNLIFYDPTYGSSITLSELIQTSQTLTAGNSMTIDGSNNIDLGGSQDADVNINTMSYHFRLHNTYDSRSQWFELDEDGGHFDVDNLYLFGRHRHTIIGDSVEYGYTSANGFYVRDKRTYPTGWEYYADYSDSLKASPNRIVSTLTVAKMINDSSEAGSWGAGVELGNFSFSNDTMSTSGDTVFVDDILKVHSKLSLGDGNTYWAGADDVMGLYNSGDLTLNNSGGDFDFYQDINPGGYCFLGNTGEHWNRAYIDTTYFDTDNDSWWNSPSDDALNLYLNSNLNMEWEEDSITFHASLIPNAWDDYLGSAGSHIGRGYIDTIYLDTDNDSYMSCGGSDDIIYFWTGGTYRYKIDNDAVVLNVNFRPSSGSSKNLGTSTYDWLNAYINNVYIDDDDDSRIYATGDDSIAINVGGTNGLTVELKSTKVTTTAHDTLKIDGDGVFIIGDSTFTDADFDFGGGSGTPAGSNYQFQYYNSGSLGASSNFGFHGNTDTLIMVGFKIYKDVSNNLTFRNTSGIDVLEINASYFGGTETASPAIAYFDNETSNTLPTYTWRNDNNTGLARPKADWIKVLAGGDSVMTFTKDSVLLNELAPSDTCVLIITPSGKVDTAELGQVADYVFNMEIGAFEDYRIYWDKNHKLKDILVSGNPYKYINSTVAALEKNFIWDGKMRDIIRGQQIEIDGLKDENKKLNDRLSGIEKRLNALEECHCIKSFEGSQMTIPYIETPYDKQYLLQIPLKEKMKQQLDEQGYILFNDAENEPDYE